jgi:hypothetical protein
VPKINAQKLVGRQAMPYGKSKVSFRVHDEHRQRSSSRLRLLPCLLVSLHGLSIF